MKLVPGMIRSIIYPELAEVRIEQTVYNSRFVSPTEITVTTEIRRAKLFGDIKNFELLEKSKPSGMSIFFESH